MTKRRKATGKRKLSAKLKAKPILEAFMTSSEGTLTPETPSYYEQETERGARAASQEMERGPSGRDQFAAGNLTELFVFGMALGNEQRRPVLILKDSTGQVALPVWLNPVDASFAMGNHAHEAYAAHSIALKLMQTFGLRIERCIFNEIKGHQQFVRLEFSQNDRIPHLEARACDAMSLCLAAGVRFYAQADVIARSREVDAELLGIEVGLHSAPEIGFRNHKYVM